MRHLALAATLVAGTVVVGTATTASAADPMTDGLVLSEYIEGSGNNKAIELYNGTGAAVSLDGVVFRIYANGRTLTDGPNATYAFPAVDLADGDVFVVANPGNALGGTIDATSGSISFNGNDAFTIVDSAGEVIDSFGQVGNDGSFSSDVTLRRTDFERDVEPEDGFDPTAQFASFGANDDSDLGVPPGGGDPDPDPDPDPECFASSADPTLISEIQGADADPDAEFDSPLDGEEVTIRAVVTLANDDLGGYFVHEEPADQDADPATSEGLFVFQSSGELPTEGQTVELTDTVTAFRGLTQLSFPDTIVCDVAPVTIEPTPLSLPLSRAEREALESMLVINAQDLQVTGLFTAYGFGELGLALDGPLPQATSVFAPGDPAAAALEADNLNRELKVNDRNEAFSSFNPFPWELFDEDLSAGDTMPAGRLVGALGYSFGEFKVEPLDNEVATGDRIFFPETDDTVPVPDAPRLRRGNDIATFNVLNYFNTFGDSAVLRGATNQEDFDVQTAKIVDAIQRLDAKIVGLIELENDYEDFYDGDPDTVPSVVTLVRELNRDAGFRKWGFIRPPKRILTDEGLGGGGLGPDAIATGIIYQRYRAWPIGPATTFDIDAELTGDVENNRWPLAQTFYVDRRIATVVVNHFKSKGSSCTDTAGPDFGLGDDVGTPLTGNCDLTRQYAANRLVDWVDSRPGWFFSRNVLLVGDFNAYEEEAPIEILVDAGYVDLVQRKGDDAFTYKFSGRYGRLDYVFASRRFARKVKDAAVWQINSIAPVGYLYDNDPIDETAHGSSDHDPVVISLK